VINVEVDDSGLDPESEDAGDALIILVACKIESGRFSGVRLQTVPVSFG
jgi:hypothetical protein